MSQVVIAPYEGSQRTSAAGMSAAGTVVIAPYEGSQPQLEFAVTQGKGSSSPPTRDRNVSCPTATSIRWIVVIAPYEGSQREV